jgi:putative ABC transport system permease protein
MNPLKLARLSLTRHKFTTIITVISIALSVACGGILLRLYKLSESRFSTIGSGGDAIVGAKSGGIEILLGSLNGEGEYPGFLPYKLFQSLRANQTVTHEDGSTTKPNYIESIIPFVYFGKYEKFRVVGTDDSFFHRPKFQDTLRLKAGSWFHDKNEIVLGSIAGKNNKVGDLIKINPWTGGEVFPAEIELKVSGILEATTSQWDRTAFSTVEEAQQIFLKYPSLIGSKSIWGPDVLNYFLVYLKPSGFASLEALINKRTVAQAILVDDQKERLQDLAGAGKSIGFFITSFVILLGGLSVCSMLVGRFEGMSLQIAVLRALGYTKKEISFWLLWEGFILGIMGVIFGALIDFLALPIIRSLLGSALPSIELVSSSILQSAMIWPIVIIAIMLSVFVPVIRMGQQDAHNALKGL